MALKAEYDKIDDVPEVHRELYSERDGKHVFTGVEGVFGPSERAKLVNETGGYRIKAREAAERLTAWQRVNHPIEGKPFEKPEDLQAVLDEYPTLRAQAEAGGGKSKEAVAAQVEIEKKRLEDKYVRQLGEKDNSIKAQMLRVEQYENRERTQAIRDHVLKAIGESKIGKLNPDAIEDVLLYAERHLLVEEERDDHGNLVIKDVRTKEGVGVTPGLQAPAWLGEMQARKGHWYMPSEGGGSAGSDRSAGSAGQGANPWSAKGWDVTAQGQYYRTHGADKAGQMARAAGTVLGGPPPMAKGAEPAGPQRSRGR